MVPMDRHLLLSILLLASAAQADVQLTFKDHVLVMGRDYVLGEVAHVQTADPDLGERLRTLVLGDTPRPGQSVTLTQFAVSARLERGVSGMAARIRWDGKRTVRVHGVGIERDGAQLTAAARQALLKQLRKQHPNVEIGVKRIGKPSPFYTPVGDLDVATRLPESMRLRSRMSVWVDVTVDGERVQTLPVWFAVEAYTDVAVANEDLRPHTAVSPAHVVIERRNIADLIAAPIVDELPDEHRTRHRIAAGDIIVATALEPIPQVQKGELITVLARHGSVALAVKARALVDGNLDDSIFVESLSSRAAYRAIVSGVGQATVE